MSYLHEEGVIYAEYQIPCDASSGNTAWPIVFEDNAALCRVVTEARGGEVTFQFSGASSVTASSVVDSTKRLPGKNHSLPDGALYGENLDKLTQTGTNNTTTLYVAAVATTTARLIIKLTRI